ncbi:type II secretion system GspH family protein [Patescibacteria group bacterium]|nr:type II secretion system GspH family protein [Patescibacteria group bacterium]
MLKNKKNKKGFTLIELLVVIAIIGILASVVLASLNTARKKSRDARRIADVKQVQLALELYFDGNGGKYPGGDETGTVVGSYGTLAPTYIATLPSDPLSGRAYQYQAFTTSSGTACAIAGNCVYYHLGVSLEETGTPALSSDRDSELTALTGDTIDGVSTVVNCGSDGAATVATDLCYDVTP